MSTVGEMHVGECKHGELNTAYRINLVVECKVYPSEVPRCLFWVHEAQLYILNTIEEGEPASSLKDCCLAKECRAIKSALEADDDATFGKWEQNKQPSYAESRWEPTVVCARSCSQSPNYHGHRNGYGAIWAVVDHRDGAENIQR